VKSVSFELRKDGATYAKCKLYNNSQCFAANINAFSNYVLHLRRQHPVKWKNRNVATTAKGKQLISSYMIPKNSPTVRKEELDCELANMLAKDRHPVNLFNGTGFQKYLMGSKNLVIAFICLLYYRDKCHFIRSHQ
jgi:hypothetical protein